MAIKIQVFESISHHIKGIKIVTITIIIKVIMLNELGGRLRIGEPLEYSKRETQTLFNPFKFGDYKVSK